MIDDTIAAISTPIGEGGVGIIRISGPQAHEVARKVFRPAGKRDFPTESHSIVYGYVEDSSGRKIDEVLLTVMKAPRTFTREDVAEINCHGGPVPLKETLKAVLAAGARVADPGEFTKRAFLNGRIDLTQAESVIDIIRSKTRASLGVALSQLNGRLSARVGEIQEMIMGILAGLEASIDFPEEGIEEDTNGQLAEKAGEIIEGLERLIESAGTGRVYREGIKTVIAGRPNVGKSSLLNALLGQERAIVTNIPGTTRDVIEETLNIRGIPLLLADTAGLRETGDLVEKIGVEKTKESLAGADLILYVVEAAEGLTDGDRALLQEIDTGKTILIINKIDIAQTVRDPELEYLPVAEISAVTGEGMESLEEKIVETVTGGRMHAPESIMVSSARHEDAIRRARDHMKDFLASLGNVPPDLLSIDARNSWEALGEITGSTVTEDLLDRIFADFCIGK